MKKIGFAALLVLSACGGEDSAVVFDAGTFQFTTNAVTDGCMDGAFDVLFMPEGTGSDWTSTTELPAFDALPTTYSIELPAPYSSMEISVEAVGTTGFKFLDATQTGVALDETQWPGCVVDMSIAADFVIVDADNVTANITMTTSGYVGDTCPAVTSDPCDVQLDLSGARVQ